MLNLPKFLFTDTTIFVNFILEKSGIELSYLFVNFWSNLTVLCCNARSVLFDGACFSGSSFC